MYTASPRGGENNGVANIETFIRQWLDPVLPDELLHWFLSPAKGGGRKTKVFWDAYRKEFEFDYGRIMEGGLIYGYYDKPESLLQ